MQDMLVKNAKPTAVNTEPKIDEDLKAMQALLKQLNAWPAAGDEFLTLIPQLEFETGVLSQVDYEWMPQVVEDALQGVDIGSRYPAFFQKTLINSALRRSFLQALRKAVF